MSTFNPYQAQANNPYGGGGFDLPPQPPRGPNVLGIIGLVLSITCCLSPIGLIVSLIALARPPRLLAVLGVIFGAIGSTIFAFVAWLTMMTAPATIAATRSFQEVQTVEQSIKASGHVPADASGLPNGIPNDGWGTPFQYVVTPDGQSWMMISAGMDMQHGTDDDMTFTPGMSESDFEAMMNSYIEKVIEKKLGAPVRHRYSTPTTQPAPATDHGGSADEEPAPAPETPAEPSSGS